MKKNNFYLTKKIFIPILFFIVIYIFPNIIEAATLSLVPNTSSISVGNIISVQVVVNTQDIYINNAEGLVQFPKDLLEIVSLTKASSIFSLWVEEPGFSNTSGNINFNGGLATPGYNGNGGSILSITFRAKKQGSANVFFSDGAVRANDGLGTNVLSVKNSATINITSTTTSIEATTNKQKGELPSKPIVYSSTNPNQDMWYRDTTASFSWQVPSGITAIQTLLDKSAISTPKIIYDNSVSQKTINGIKEGISYFHIRFQNANGWGPITNFKIKIDSSSPDTFSPSVRTENGRNIIKLDAIDAMSGIDYYLLSIDGQENIKVNKKDLENDEFTLPIEKGEGHNLAIEAYDKAGNMIKENIEFTSPSITPPSLSMDVKEIKTGGSVTLQGLTNYSDVTVEVTLLSGGNVLKKYKETPSKDGRFSFVTDTFSNAGTISFYAENVFTNGTRSEPSEKIYLKVIEGQATVITWKIVKPVVIIASEFLLVSLMFFLIYLGWYKFFGFKKRTKQELKNTAKNVHRSFSLLKEELDKQLQILEKVKEDRILNKKEEKIFSDIKKNIDDIDDFIEDKLDKLI